jgi:hypothetical protein
VDRGVVGTRKLIDLDLEAEVHADIGGVVVAFFGWIREVEEHSRVVVWRPHHPLQAQHIARRCRAREPEESEVGPGSALEHALADQEAAGIVATGLVANGRHGPIAQRRPIEQQLEARIWCDSRRAANHLIRVLAFIR